MPILNDLIGLKSVRHKHDNSVNSFILILASQDEINREKSTAFEVEIQNLQLNILEANSVKEELENDLR